MIRPSKHQKIMAARRRRYRAEEREFMEGIVMGIIVLIIGFTLGPWQFGVFFGGGFILVTIITEPRIRKKRMERRNRTGRGELSYKDLSRDSSI